MSQKHDKWSKGRELPRDQVEMQRQQQQQQQQQQQRQVEQAHSSYSVFISYSHKDNEAVHRFVADLSRHDIQVRLDEDIIAPGEPWADKLNKAIEDSQAVIIVLSQHTAQSKWQTSEIAFALAAQRRGSVKRVIPVRINKDAEVPFFLRDRAYCDLSTKENYSRNMEQLIATIQKPAERMDQKRIEKATLEAIKAGKAALQKEIEAQSRKKILWRTIILGALASAVAASLTVLFALIKTIRWEFVGGFAIGILGSLLATFIVWTIAGKPRNREVGHGK